MTRKTTPTASTSEAQYDLPGGGIVFKADGGDRRKNLEAIADEIERTFDAGRDDQAGGRRDERRRR